MESEVWRSLGWAHYSVSSLGRVRNEKTKRVLKGRIDSRGIGYMRVTLRDLAGTQKDYFIHRLVCEAFHGPQPEPGMEVDHINAVPGDDRQDNLRWVTVSENRATRRIARGQEHWATPLTDDQVRQIKGHETSHLNNRKAADLFGVSRQTIRDIRNGKVWRHVNV